MPLIIQDSRFPLTPASEPSQLQHPTPIRMKNDQRIIGLKHEFLYFLCSLHVLGALLFELPARDARDVQSQGSPSGSLRQELRIKGPAAKNRRGRKVHSGARGGPAAEAQAPEQALQSTVRESHSLYYIF